MRKIGVITGNGKLPLYFLEKAETNGLDIFPIGLFDTIEKEILTHKNFKFFHIGQIGDLIKYLLNNEIKELIMLGKVEKQLLFQDLQLDKYGEELLRKLPDRKDETLLFGIISFLQLNGIRILNQTKFIDEFLLQRKCYTKRIPEKTDWMTIKIGIEAAKALSRVDAGQCVICKDSSVIALEGVEGTDRCIARGGELGGNDTIIVKMARPQQDMKVDVPVIGIETIRQAAQIKARGLVGEAKKMMLLNEDQCVYVADQYQMFLVGI
jgi:DUF1009 family protein